MRRHGLVSFFLGSSARSAGVQAALLIALAGALPRAGAETPAGLKAILEIDRDAYYAGDPVPVRISIWNDGTSPIDAPGGGGETGFELFDVDGKKVPPPTAPENSAAPPGTRPLQPGAFFGFARDLTTLYPRLKQAGTYRLQWRQGGLLSNPVILRVVPKYDPAKDYTALVETDLGPFTIEFLRRDSPITVKTFVELALSGYYDGVVFHYVEAGRLVASGDPTGSGTGGPGFAIPPERPPVKMLAGTVFMKPQGQPPANGSIFAILLAPRPDFEGVVTGFGQVVEGLDVLKKISQVPSAPRTAGIPHKPLKDVRINRVVIKTKGA